jgi:hypothetical protein
MSAGNPASTPITPGPEPKGIDPRGPRFTAGVTAILLLVTIALALLLPTPWPAFALFAVLSALFAIGAFAGVTKGPWSIVFRKLIRPRLKAPLELEDPIPPTFAQGVGFFITLVGLVLHLLGVPYAIVIFASLAFVAAFLNSVFAFCLGCQIYLLLVRAGILGRNRSATA